MLTAWFHHPRRHEKLIAPLWWSRIRNPIGINSPVRFTPVTRVIMKTLWLIHWQKCRHFSELPQIVSKNPTLLPQRVARNAANANEAINLLHLVRKFELFRVEANVFLFSLKNKRFLKIEGSHFRLRHSLLLLLPQAMSINRYCPSPSFLRSVPRWRSHSRAKRSDIQSRGIVYSWPAPRT